VEWQHRKTGRVLARELYDHRRNPAENVNISSDPFNLELVKQLSAQLVRGWKAALPAARS
jgi:hypothetical protein